MRLNTAGWRQVEKVHGIHPMKKLLLAILAGALLAPPVAIARDWRGSRGPQLQVQGQPVKKAPSQPRRERDKRLEHGKRHQQNRLTDQERRDLRRDLDRADREIYRR